MQQQTNSNSNEHPSMLAYRVTMLETEVNTLKSQFNAYTPTRENDLRLQNIQDTLHRIEIEVQQVKSEVNTQNDKLVTLQQSQDRKITDQQTDQQKVVIRVLWGMVCGVFGVVLTLIVSYLTRLVFH